MQNAAVVEELSQVVGRLGQITDFTRDERHILAQSLDFSQLSVADLMRPINEVIALHANKSLEENLQTVVRNRFSRYPYFDANGEDVLGVMEQTDVPPHEALNERSLDFQGEGDDEVLMEDMDEDLGENVAEGQVEDEDADAEPDDHEGAYFDPTSMGLKEINNLAHFGVSSHKPGNGVEELLSDDLDKYWQ